MSEEEMEVELKKETEEMLEAEEFENSFIDCGCLWTECGTFDAIAGFIQIGEGFLLTMISELDPIAKLFEKEAKIY